MITHNDNHTTTTTNNNNNDNDNHDNNNNTHNDDNMLIAEVLPDLLHTAIGLDIEVNMIYTVNTI